MAETFQDLKVKLIEHYRRVQSADELTAGFNRLVDGEELRQLIGGLKKTFPKEPALGDEYTMYFAYAMMQADQRTAEDLLDWRDIPKNSLTTVRKTIILPTICAA